MSRRRAIINCETLEYYDSVRGAAKCLGCNPANIVRNIITNRKTKGYILDYYDEWIYLSDAEKQKHSIKNNIYFMGGRELKPKNDNNLIELDEAI